MKKWHVYSIIIVLTIALMGLVYVQSIYVKRGLIIQSQIFDQYVSEALMRVAIKIEEEEAYKLLKKPNLDNIYDNAQRINGNCGLNLSFQNGNIILDVKKDEELITFIGTTLNEIDSLVAFADLGEEIELELQTGLIDGYNEMIEDMTMQFLYGSNVKPSFDSTKIYNYLKYELDRITINTPFNFALVDGYTFRRIFSTFEKLNSSVHKKAYKAPVHSGFFSDEHAILLLDFPKKRSFLLKSNGSLLSSSFVFILLIAVSFGASILIIFKQKKLSELKTDFINNMTHELKTPVATISLATEMLDKEKVRKDDSKVANYNNIIRDENKRLGSHIEKVLQIAQLDRDELRLKKDTIDINDLILELLGKFQLRLEDVSAAVTFDQLAAVSTIKGDQNHLTNVLSNLLDNAIKYKKDGQLNINISTKVVKKSIEIRIQDNGIGMNKSDLKKIFTKFYRVSTGNIHNVKGFGLGLSYVKTIIEAHKGTIEVESEPNKFTTFIVTLPLTKKLSI